MEFIWCDISFNILLNKIFIFVFIFLQNYLLARSITLQLNVFESEIEDFFLR